MACCLAVKMDEGRLGLAWHSGQTKWSSPRTRRHWPHVTHWTCPATILRMSFTGSPPTGGGHGRAMGLPAWPSNSCTRPHSFGAGLCSWPSSSARRGSRVHGPSQFSEWSVCHRRCTVGACASVLGLECAPISRPGMPCGPGISSGVHQGGRARTSSVFGWSAARLYPKASLGQAPSWTTLLYSLVVRTAHHPAIWLDRRV